MLYLLLLSFLCVISTSGGNNVVLGLLGNSAFIECQLPVSDTLIWQTEDGYVIAINGRVTNENSTKYIIEKQSGRRQSLVIHDLTLADDNVISCFDLKNASRVDSTKLTVLTRPLTMTTTVTPPQPMLEGTQVTLTCEADGGKPLPTIQWYIQDINGSLSEPTGNITDMVYQNGTGHRRHDLLVNVTRAIYKAKFICNVSVPLLYQETFTLDTDILLAPKEPNITVENFDGSFDSGTELKVTCTSQESRPTATIYWLLDGNRLGDAEVVVKPDGNGTTTVQSTFSKVMTKQYNGSVLTCAVTNRVLSDRGLPPRTTKLILFESYKPIVTTEQNIYTREENENVTLRCHIDAKPIPHISQLYWTRGGIVVDRRFYNASNDSTVFELALNEVNRSDAGNYSCHATNRVGVSTSEPVQLKVHYTPQCAFGTVQKMAVKQGDITHINCHMYASPNDVILTWRYHKTDERITTMAAIADTQNEEHVYNTLELRMGFQLKYADIACYGNNSRGVTTSPCLYRIVPPGPAEVPTNCTTSVEANNVTIQCTPGFSGGSDQHFLLQKLGNIEYETILYGELPNFSLQSYDNLTVRICAFNDDYKNFKNCAEARSIIVDNTGTSNSETSSTKNNRAAYIAGGVTAATGAVIIAIIVILLLLKYRKDKKHKNSFSVEEKTSKSKKAKEWLKSLKFPTLRHGKRNDQNTRNSTANTTSATNGNYVVTDIDKDDQPYQDVFVLASTPHHNLNTCRINRKASCSLFYSEVDLEPSQLEVTPIAPDILNENTGFALSPIACPIEKERASVTSSNNNETVVCLDDVFETASDHTTTRTNIATINKTSDAGVTNGYNTEDIINVLGCSKAKQLSIDHLDETACKVHAKTLHKEYTDGDIDDALSSTDANDSLPTDSLTNDSLPTDTLTSDSLPADTLTNDEFKEQLATCGPSITPNSAEERSLSETFDNSDIIIKFLHVDFSKEAIEEDDSSKVNNISKSELYEHADSGANYSNFVSTAFRKSFSAFSHRSSGTLEKGQSLPNRTKKQRRSLFMASSILNGKVKKTELGQNTSTPTSNNNDKQKRLENSLTSDMFSSDTASYTTAIDFENRTFSERTSVASNFTDKSETLRDIDEFTLTLTSEATTEYDSKDWVSATDFNTISDDTDAILATASHTDASDPICDIDQFTLIITSDTTDQTLSELHDETLVMSESQPSALYASTDFQKRETDFLSSTPRREVLRRNSFLEAINNDLVEDDNSTDTCTTTVNLEADSSFLRNNEMDSSFINYGYEPDSENTCIISDVTQSFENSTSGESSVQRSSLDIPTSPRNVPDSSVKSIAHDKESSFASDPSHDNHEGLAPSHDNHEGQDSVNVVAYF